MEPGRRRRDVLVDRCQREVGRVLRLEPARVNVTVPLTGMGLDSLMALEVKKGLGGRRRGRPAGHARLALPDHRRARALPRRTYGDPARHDGHRQLSRRTARCRRARRAGTRRRGAQRRRRRGASPATTGIS
ncbi:acyl carrier protein [Streptomyces sp. L7]